MFDIIAAIYNISDLSQADLLLIGDTTRMQQVVSVLADCMNLREVIESEGVHFNFIGAYK